MSEDANTLKIGRIEDKIRLYEPFLTNLQAIGSIPKEIGVIHTELGTLKESRIEVREQLKTLFRNQNKAYDDIVKKLEEKTKILEKEIDECPIDNFISRLTDMEQNINTIKMLEGRLKTAEDTIETFKLKGWDLLLRIVPWMLATATTAYAILK